MDLTAPTFKREPLTEDDAMFASFAAADFGLTPEHPEDYSMRTSDQPEPFAPLCNVVPRAVPAKPPLDGRRSAQGRT